MRFSIKDFFSKCDQIRVTFYEEILNGKLNFLRVNFAFFIEKQSLRRSTKMNFSIKDLFIIFIEEIFNGKLHDAVADKLIKVYTFRIISIFFRIFGFCWYYIFLFLLLNKWW